MRPRVLGLLALLAALSPAPATRAQDVIADLRADRWADAQTDAARYPDPVAAKLVTYYRLIAPGAGAAAEIAGFMAQNPDWPLQTLLARRRDEALAAEPDDATALDLCGRVQPASAMALARCADAYSALGHPDEAAAAARRAWLGGFADPISEARFMQRWGAVITPGDQRLRFEALARSNTSAAERQVGRLDAADQPAATAWLALRRDDSAALDLLAAVPAPARADPGLFLEQARWLRRAGQDDAALALWELAGTAEERAAAPAHRAEFWAERSLLARRRLQLGDAIGAYALASEHAQTTPEQVADAEFLAGFIALRRMNDPKAAAHHFTALAAISRAAITQARAHYWLGRAAAAGGDAAAARREYAAAAAWPTTYYGQLAALALGEGPVGLNARIRGLRDPGWGRQQAIDFAGREVARAAAELVAWGDPHRARVFVLRLQELAPDAADQSMTARLAIGFGLPDQAVAVARRAGLHGLMLAEDGWPLAAAVPDGPVPPALALGLIRQESSFDVGALSPAGARGLMQLMPATAQAVAQRIGARASAAALTSDAALNVQLGTAYLADLLDTFGGAVPLAVAAYNAGPNRVQQWLAENGDPRGGPVDMLDWIELIPFGETRNYVQRVVENVVIYHAKRDEALPHPLAAWLH
ncbi:MAG: lytic transglycosylase domain-containing protein [Acidisphaera sp.]|nr:lytic transglycosylase domain-containing protein [Acidisphaera sp.]